MYSVKGTAEECCALTEQPGRFYTTAASCTYVLSDLEGREQLVAQRLCGHKETAGAIRTGDDGDTATF